MTVMLKKKYDTPKKLTSRPITNKVMSKICYGHIYILMVSCKVLKMYFLLLVNIILHPPDTQ